MKHARMNQTQTKSNWQTNFYAPGKKWPFRFPQFSLLVLWLVLWGEGNIFSVRTVSWSHHDLQISPSLIQYVKEGKIWIATIKKQKKKMLESPAAHVTFKFVYLIFHGRIFSVPRFRVIIFHLRMKRKIFEFSEPCNRMIKIVFILHYYFISLLSYRFCISVYNVSLMSVCRVTEWGRP